MLSKFIGFLVVGRILIFVGQKFPAKDYLFTGNRWKFLSELLECDLCFGTWIYSFLSFITGVNLIEELFGRKHRVFGSIITGAVSSFLVHVFRIGWNEKFSITAIFQQPDF